MTVAQGSEFVAGGKTLANPVDQVIDGDQGKSDFTQVFGQLPVEMDLTSSIAIMPAECFELVDGLIVY